jgi:hypothetical protein
LLPRAVTRLLAAAALIAGAMANGSTALANTESSYASRNGFSFAVLGDAPASIGDESITAHVLAQIGHEADLIIHVGNIKGRNERCDDDLYLRRRALFETSPVPFVMAPGQHDWTDCDQTTAGRYGPIERLTRLRELFFESSQSLGALKQDLQRLSDTGRYRNYPENARWEYGGILFVTLNIPATHNNYRTGAGRNGEYEERILANAFWVRQAFAMATREKYKGIVIAFNADPNFEGRLNLDASDGRDPYADFRATLARLAAKYSGQVLLLHSAHGNTGPAPKPDHPLKAAGKTLDNVTRLKTFGASRPQSWRKVVIEPGKKGQFVIENRNAVLQPPQP